MEFASSATTEVMKFLARATWQQARYSFCFDCLVEELDEEKKKLKANVKDMNDKVKGSQENTEKVGKLLKLKLEKSKDVIKEVDELVKKVKPKKTCCHGPCPDLIWQYRLGSQVANKTETMKKLNAQSQPEKVSLIRPLKGMEYFSSEGFMCFGSTKKASDELMKALKNNEIRRIGLYGMGGCGKTTLVKEVGKEAEKLFKKVVFVAVSSTLEVRKIQGSIADALNLTLKEENEPERARRLSMRLSGREKILIILDDVWEELNFEAIGIPFGYDHKGCRILLTTRQRGVCVSLKCHKMVCLDLLTEKEAWQLFQSHAGINEYVSKKSLKGLPEVINKACKGLPVAIVAVASTLKEKTLVEWNEVFDMLKRCEQVDIENNSKDPYASLQLSYDHLKKKEAKDLFLLCSLFPEDSEIMEEDLIRMARGLGIFENVYSWNSARIRGGATIKKLLDSFLLLQAKKGRSVVLHDMLRAVALKIADKEIQMISEPTKYLSLKELADGEGIEKIKKLYCHNIIEFPFQFKCPKLEILIVCKYVQGSSELPDEFFKEMGGLKVLIVIEKSSWQNSTLMLPKSIWLLTCLRTLCIRGCRLHFIISVENLQNLETLEFSNCSIMQLPNDIAELKKLKLLDVSRCRIGGNPYEVLGNCPRLEELYFAENDLDEKLLKDQNLAEFFGKNDYFTKLGRYHVQIGARVDKLKDDQISGFLSVCPYSDQDTSTSTIAIKDLAQRAEVLFLENIPKSHKNVIPDIVHQEGECMKDLIELLLRNSDGMKCLVDTTNQLNQIGTVFTNLHKLRITGMKCMEGFCHGEPPSALFEQLKELECSQLPILSSLGKPKLSNLLVLKLESCPKLESLFTPAVAVSLVLLEELKITKCHGLMYIIGDDKEENITDDNDQKSYGLVFKKLKELVVGDCLKLEYLIPLSFAWSLENLEILKIYIAPNLKYAFGQYNRTHQSCFQNENVARIINLPVLKVLELLNLPEIINICPENYNAKFPDLLESHMVDNCPNLNTIISTNTPKVDSEIEGEQDGEAPNKAKSFFMPSGICTSIFAENDRNTLSFNRYVEDLRTEKETLRFTRESLQNRVEKARREALAIDIHVLKWLDNAGTLIEEAEKLEQKAIANRSCCLGLFPNWIQRYRLGKLASRKRNAMIKHNESREFQKISQRASLPRMEDYFQEDFIFFDSRKSIYYSLLEALKEDEISIIGLYGMGGSGKTSLVKQVGKAVENEFNIVAFAVVSNTVDVRKIQVEIASCLGLNLEGKETFVERARSLWLRLSNGEKILIILDDVWEKLDFEVIGIPFGENNKRCRVLLTTRRVQVCTLMGCQRTIPLLLLTEEEAWTLFQKHAEITDNTFDSLKDLAKEITKECKGLPVAIAAVAGSLKGKTLTEWKEALKILKEAVPMDVEEGLKNPYNFLQLSYDNLNNTEAKSLFLLCSVFPEDFEIHEEYLARYGIGLGLFGEVGSYERARNQVNKAKNKLIDSCLLLKANEEQCVKMHDLVRDVVLWIAKKENKVIMGPESNGWVLQNNTTFEDNSLRYLWCDNVHKLPNQLHCSKLEFLYVNDSENLILPNGFFNGMEDLRVVVLRNESYLIRSNLTVEKSIPSLSNLVSLFLEGWQLDDTSFVVRLRRLEALVLWNCSFRELSNEITELSKLRLLDLSKCVIERNPYETIGRCSQLQELYFTGNACAEWEYQGANGVAFEENEITLKLERYRIEIGNCLGVFDKEDFSISRGLSIEYFDAATANATLKNLVQRAEVLSLGKISGGCKNISPDMVQKIGDGMNELVELQLCNSDEIKCMIDTSGHVGAVFPRLTKLRLLNLEHMKALCYGPPPPGFFEKLKELFLYDCPRLTSLFTATIAQSLVLLEVLEIKNCYGLRHIVRDAEEEIIAIDDDHNNKSAFPKLEVLVVEECQQLEYLGGHWSFNLCNLKTLTVEFCPSLKSLFTLSTAKTMASLEELIIIRCDNLKEVFEGPHGEDAQALMLPRLKMLRFIKLPILIDVSHGFKLQRVKNVVVEDCPMFSGSVDGFQNLSQGQNPVEEEGTKVEEEPEEEDEELESESKEEEKGKEVEVQDRNVIGQSTTSSQKSSEIYNAQAGIPNMDDTPLPVITASSSGEVDAVHRSSINISNEDRDVTQTSLNQDVAPLAATNQDVNSSALIAATNQEYQTQEEGGNQKKMEDNYVIEQSTINYPESIEAHKTQNETSLPEPTLQTSPCPQIVPEDLQPERVAQSVQEYNQNDHDIKSDKGRGDSQIQGLDTSINHFDTQQSLQEQNISLKESKKEIAKESQQKGHAAEKSTSATSSLDFVVEQPIRELVLVDRQEGLEQNQVTIEFLERTDATSEVVHNAIDLTNNSFSKASTTKKLQNVARTSPISQSCSSIANAAVSPGSIPSGLDLNKTTEIIIDFPKLWEDSCQGQRKEGKHEHHLDNLNSRVVSSGEATLELHSSVPVAFEENKVPVGDLPSDLNLNNETKQWDNFDSGLGPSSSLEVKPNKVAESVQDYQESELQTQTMTRLTGELQTQEIHQEQKMPQICSVNKGQSVKGRAEETAQKDPTLDEPKLTVSQLELVKNVPQSELALMDQQHALEENKASRKLQFLATSSQLSPISAPPPASHQSLGSVAETSGSHALPSVTGTTATSDPPPTSDTAIPSLLQDLLSRLHLLLSSEAMSHLRNGFSRYPWALHLLESWSDKSWNWSYFVIFARVLCILQTTAAADLSEALCAELSSSLSTLGNVGFDANWIAAVHTRIRDCQASLANLHEAKALRATKDGIAGRLAEFESLVDTIRTELAGIDLVLADYAHKEELARNVIGLP